MRHLIAHAGKKLSVFFGRRFFGNARARKRFDGFSERINFVLYGFEITAEILQPRAFVFTNRERKIRFAGFAQLPGGRKNLFPKRPK